MIRKLTLLILGSLVTVAAVRTSRDQDPAVSGALPAGRLDGKTVFDIALMLQSDIRGSYGPCDCPVLQLGGFARRTAYWKAFQRHYPSNPFLRIDGGSIFSTGRAESPVINRWILEGTKRSGLDALNLTASDLPVWEEMADLAASGRIQAEWLQLPLVSANVRPRTTRFPAVRPYLIRDGFTSSGKRVRFGITGLLLDEERRISRETFEIDEPQAAAARTIGNLQALADYRIVLTDMDLGKAIVLAASVPGINLILVAHNYNSLSEDQMVGETLVTIPVNQGRMITEVRLEFESGLTGANVETRLVPLDDKTPDDPAMADLIQRAEHELAAFRREAGLPK